MHLTGLFNAVSFESLSAIFKPLIIGQNLVMMVHNNSAMGRGLDLGLSFAYDLGFAYDYVEFETAGNITSSDG
jgi:hypothetical protein